MINGYNPIAPNIMAIFCKYYLIIHAIIDLCVNPELFHKSFIRVNIYSFPIQQPVVLLSFSAGFL